MDVPVLLSILKGRLEAQDFQEHINGVPRSSLREDIGEAIHYKMISPHKWEIDKFIGKNKSISITAFFEKVEELSVARNVPKSVLFELGFDLFREKAYHFYKDCRTKALGKISWKNFDRRTCPLATTTYCLKNSGEELNIPVKQLEFIWQEWQAILGG